MTDNKTSQEEQGRQRTVALTMALTAVILSLVLCTPALAGEVIVTVLGGAGSSATARLASPDGDHQTARDDDRDGVLILAPEGGSGAYELTVALGEQRATETITVPEHGQVSVVFNPRGGEQLSVVYAGGNERIVVMARKRQEDLQTTPISITAFPSEVLEERSMQDASDLADFTPNMEFATTTILGGSSSQATVYIRGVGQISESIYSDPGVGIYVDGVYLARSQGAVFDLLDLERAEVLRGPQGTLFGKNTMGGAVNLITRKPDAGFDSDVEIGAGSFGRREGRFRGNAQLGEKTFGSLALASRRSDGVTESLSTGEDYFDDDRDTGRLALRFLPSERLSVDFSIDATRERENAVDITLLAVDESIPILGFYNSVARTVGFPAYDETWITGDLLRSYSTAPNFSRVDVGGTALTLDWQLKSLTLRSMSSYREVDEEVSNDFDASPLAFAYVPSTTEQEQWSEEVQLLGRSIDDRLDWVVGGLYFREKSHGTNRVQLLGGLFEALEAAPGPIFAPPGLPHSLCDPGPAPPGLACFGGAGNPFNQAFWIDPERHNTTDLTTVSSAVFGEGNFAWSDRLSVSAGLRYTSEDKDVLTNRIPGPDSPLPVVTAFNEDTWDALTPRLSLAYQARPDLFIFASVADGFMSGGFNPFGDPGLDLLRTYEPEELRTWELGFKTDQLDNRLRLNWSVFWNDYTNLQLTASLIENGEALFLIENAGKVEAKGFELELQAQPTTELLLNLGVGHVDARYVELDDTVRAVTLDDTLPRTPEWNLVFSPQYTFLTKGDGAVILRADYTYKTKFYNDVANNEAAAQAAFGLFHARASWVAASGRYEVSLWGKNLADERYLEHGHVPEAFGPSYGVAGRPREWGLSVRLRPGN